MYLFEWEATTLKPKQKCLKIWIRDEKNCQQFYRFIIYLLLYYIISTLFTNVDVILLKVYEN